MTPEVLIEHVEQSIEKASNHESWIDEDILSLKGFSTGVMRRMFSNICHLPKEDPVYCEVGLYGGATFCAAMNNNRSLTAFGVEDFSESFGDETIRKHLESNLEKYKSHPKEMHVLNYNFFTMDLGLITKPVDVYFYDGHHSYEFQCDALPYFINSLSDIFVWVVDDYNWIPVREGTQDGLKQLKDKIKVQKEWIIKTKVPDDPVFHNGLYLAVISKI